MTVQAIAFERGSTTKVSGTTGWWMAPLRASRVGVWQCAAAFALLLAIVFARAPLRQIPDALFVSDGFGYYIYLPSLVVDRDLDLSNQLTRVPYEAGKSYFDEIPASGRRADPFPVGPAVLWLPFFVMAHVAVSALHAAGVGVSPSGFGYAYELPTYIGAFLYGLAGLWLMQRLVAQLFSREIAAATLLAMLIGTPYAYYLWVEPDVSHIAAAFSGALFLYTLWSAMRDRDATAGRWIAIGATLGVVALVRPYNGLVAAATLPGAWYLARSGAASPGAMFVRLVICGLTSLLVFVPQMAVATILYGHLTFLPPGTGYDEMMWTRPDVRGLIVSLFSYFPLLLVAFCGLVLRRGSRDGSAPGFAVSGHAADAYVAWIRVAGLGALLVVLYITASYPRGSTFGDSFGQRRIVDWVPLLSLGFASCLAAVPPHRKALALKSVVLLAALGAVLTALYTVKLLPEWGMTGLLQ